jgi:nucleotide-binding universal stress UspA family protein
MIHILFPTDFSSHANMSLKYAVDLCNKVKGQLHIISAFQVIRSASTLISMREVILKNTEEDMTKLVTSIVQLIDHDMIPITSVIEGDTTDIIENYAKRKNIDLIIMGTQGSNSLKTVLFGSVTKKTVRNTKTPLLAIPMSETPINLNEGKFLLAVDNQEIGESLGFKLLSKMLDRMNKKLDIIHITEKPNADIFPFDPFIKNYLDDQMGEINIIENKDPINAIKSYVENNDVGMLVMKKRQHSFMERLLFKGNTGQELLITNVPLMIIPE